MTKPQTKPEPVLGLRETVIYWAIRLCLATEDTAQGGCVPGYRSVRPELAGLQEAVEELCRNDGRAFALRHNMEVASMDKPTRKGSA
jgi:hypothetical protein